MLVTNASWWLYVVNWSWRRNFLTSDQGPIAMTVASQGIGPVFLGADIGSGDNGAMLQKDAPNLQSTQGICFGFFKFVGTDWTILQINSH